MNYFMTDIFLCFGEIVKFCFYFSFISCSRGLSRQHEWLIRFSWLSTWGTWGSPFNNKWVDGRSWSSSFDAPQYPPGAQQSFAQASACPRGRSSPLSSVTFPAIYQCSFENYPAVASFYFRITSVFMYTLHSYSWAGDCLDNCLCLFSIDGSSSTWFQMHNSCDALNFWVKFWYLSRIV